MSQDNPSKTTVEHEEEVYDERDEFIDEEFETEDQPKKRKKRIRRINVEWEGEKMILPEGMDYEEAIKALQKRQQQDEQHVTLTHTIRAFPHDGCVAFQKALRQTYGWTTLKGQPGGLFWGPSPPSFIAVQIGFDDAIQVPWGACTVPKIQGTINPGWVNEDGLPCFQLSATVRRADEKAFERIVELTKEFVRKESIYKGQPVKLKFRDHEGDPKDFDPGFCPKFMDLKSFDPTELVLPEAAANSVQVNLWNPIEHTAHCRSHNIPLKRGVVMEGGFGTGKTLTAKQTAQLCVEHGWTFILLDDVRDLHQALQFARMYEPCVVFAEDIDKATSGKRSDDMNQIFNTIDGLESKGHEIMTVLTTNRIGVIHPGFIRPGRVDSIIAIGPPDEPAVVKLVRRYSQNDDGKRLVSDEVPDDAIIKAMEPVKCANAAFIREVVERAKLSAISHVEESGGMNITADDLHTAAESMKPHLLLVSPEAQQNEFQKLMGDSEQVDPLKFAADIMMDEMVYKIFENIANPKVLKQIILKQKKRRPPGPGGSFSNN